MRAIPWQAAAFLLLVVSAGCTKSSDPAVPLPVRVTVSDNEVLANGTNSVTVSVTDPAGGPITVTTDRGTFPGGVQTATVAGAAGTLALTTCDASTTSGCAGTVHLSAAGAGTAAARTLTFGTLASLCPANCAVDPGCATLACTRSGGGAGVCSSTVPSACLSASACTPSPAGATTETDCADGVDNDCSNGTDGADPVCEGRPCQAGSSTLVWKAGVCTDVTAGLGIKLTPARTRLPANGTTTTAVVVEATSGTAPVAGVAISASATLGTLAPATATTGADGTATFTFTSSASVGVATITASLVDAPTIRQSATITMPRLGSFQLGTNPGPLQHPVMGARGSAWNEAGWIQVQVLDDVGDPYPDGLAVRFEHRPLGGSALLDPAAATASCPAATCVAHVSATTSGTAAADSAGLASASLASGTLAGTLAVTASASAAGVSIAADLPAPTVIGAKASGANFSVVCSPRNLPALAETDCAISLVDAPFSCEALVKDRFSNVLGTATQVVFVAEASAVGLATATPAYDGTVNSAQAGLGVAVQSFSTLGAGLPFDVAPVAGEPSVVDAIGLDGCGPRTRNPRDGVVTVIAIADGEEAFFDANGNGTFDAGEPFVDLGEPFVDEDDDGQHDAGEWFLDVDGDHAYTPANGTWDASTKLWTQTVVVFTGQATTLDAGAGLLGTRIADLPLADACAPTPAPTPFDLAVAVPPATVGETASYAVIASDLNLNFLTTGTAYAAAAAPAAADVTVTYGGLPSYADLHGFDYRFWPCADGGAGACAAQCKATGGPYPCQMRPAISNYSCGVAALASVTAADVPTAADLVFTVDVPWNVFGAARTQHVVAAVPGVAR